jgi:putative Holliday junction resolvase
VTGIPGGSEQSEKVAAQARRLAARLETAAQAAGVALQFFETDERFSTAQAHNELREAGISSRQSRGSSGSFAIDARAAAVFLQTFLDSRNPGTQTFEAPDDEPEFSSTLDHSS